MSAKDTFSLDFQVTSIDIQYMDTSLILLAFGGVTLGGFLKGATGAGAPVVGVPILAIVFGVPMAVAIFSVLNLVSNAWQSKTFYHEITNRRFAWVHAATAAVGVVPGSLLLATLPTEILMAAMGCVVFAYVGLRVARPGWVLSAVQGERLGPVMGFAGGVMQGAGGLSAPISVSFLNALRLSRLDFIGTISVFFLAMSVLQVPTLAILGVLTMDRVGLAALAVVPLFLGISLGSWSANYLSKEAFDRAILGLLTLIAVKLMWDAIF